VGHTRYYGLMAHVDAVTRGLAAVGGGAVLLLLAGCGKAGYYTHVASGHWQLMAARQPIERLVGDADTDPALAATLREVLAIRRFAIDHLALPDSDSYTRYADLQRDAAVWNVMAAPRYGLTPRETCFIGVGCVSYQGFFDRQRAQDHATRLAGEGWDVAVIPVSAYSTLGWFADPVLNTMVRQGRARLLATVIHELAHERLFIKGDTAFNESYASFVEREGWQQWRAQAAVPPSPDETRSDARQRAFTALVMEARERLAADYAAHAGDPEVLDRVKADGFARLRRDYRHLREQQWQGWDGYDPWFDQPLNNAHLLPFALYDQWVDAFSVLFDEHQRHWPSFHAAVAALGAQSPDARQAALRALDARAAAAHQ
jgi:predicted aminopeptidase